MKHDLLYLYLLVLMANEVEVCQELVPLVLPDMFIVNVNVLVTDTAHKFLASVKIFQVVSNES